MTINVEKNDSCVTLKIDGRVDTTTAPALEKEIILSTDEAQELVLDMEKVEYISSAGLRVLLSAQKKISQIGMMKLVNVSEIVMEVFEMTGFADILTIE
ncbi:MAG: STAS domain-containing protein [Eubacteriales bacterium]|nr:STAS domain-containing protein [Eubacteriales bacterium]